jgi:phage repressor protein C with HTH and peptisase S24 domain
MKIRKTPDQLINDLLRELGFGRDVQLAEWLGVSAQAVSQARRKGKIPEGWLVQAAERAGLSLDALLFGDVVHDMSDDENPISMVPLVAAKLSAGGGSLETEDAVIKHFAFHKDWLERKGNLSDMVLMRVSGDSMEPVICHNDMVLVDRGKKRIVPGTVFAVGVDDGIYVKQIDMLPGHRLVLHSFNKRYAPIEIDMNGDLADSVRILGKVLWWCHEA